MTSSPRAHTGDRRPPESAIVKARRWLSNRLHLLAVRVYDDFHTMTLSHPDRTDVESACYWQWTGSWAEDWVFECDCDEDVQ